MANESIRPDVTGTVTPNHLDPAIEEDIRPYQEAAKGQAPQWIDEPVEGTNLRHYKGFLGDFQYDPSQFELQMVKPPAGVDPNEPGFEVLRYVGKETDGHKIKIPEGINSTFCMFYGTDIKSVPVIPQGVESAQCMFGDCKNLKDGRTVFPSSLENTEMMFAGCHNMTKGPAMIPGSVKHADAMFFQCVSMKNTPVLANGLQTADDMFSNCRSMKDPPRLPRSLSSSSGMTYGCTGIDAAKDAALQKAKDKAREKFEKKLNRPTLGSRVGSMFSALMQVHAMRKMGYGFVMAPIMAHQMRKAGVFSRDFSGGVAAVAMGHGGMAGRAVYQLSMNASAKNAEKQQRRREEKLAQWDRLYGQGTDFNRQMKAQAAKGSRDEKNNLFLRILDMTSPEKKIYRESHGNAAVYQTQEQVLRENWSTSAGDVAEKKKIAKWYKDQLADKVAYCAEAESAIMRDTRYSSAKRDQALAGLSEMKQIMFEPLMSSMKNLQRDYQLFNEGDQRDIDKMLYSATGQHLFQGERQEQHSHRVSGWEFERVDPAAQQTHESSQPQTQRQGDPEVRQQSSEQPAPGRAETASHDRGNVEPGTGSESIRPQRNRPLPHVPDETPGKEDRGLEL